MPKLIKTEKINHRDIKYLLDIMDYPEEYSFERDENQQLKALIKITKLINSTINIDLLLNVIINAASLLTNSEESSLLLLDKKKERLIFHTVSGETGEILKNITIPIDVGVAGLVVQTNMPQLVSDAQSDARLFKGIDQITKMTTKNLLAVPMRTPNREIIGVIECVNSKSEHGFTIRDEEMLVSLAEQAAIVFTNRKLLRKIRLKVKELTTLYELGQSLLDIETPDELFAETINIVKDIQKDYGYAILSLQDSCFTISSSYCSDSIENIDIDVKIPASHNLFLSLQELEHYSFLMNNLDESDNELFLLFNRLGIDADKSQILWIPFITNKEKKFFAALLIWSIKKEKLFGTSTQKLLKTVVNQVIEAYENIRLRIEEEEKKRMQKELDIMRNLQQSILPKIYPDYKGLKIAGINLPALEVGGDFYDFIPFDDNKFGISIADVAGKGMPAALFMALSRSTMRAFAKETLTPREVLKEANKLIYSDSESGMFVTLFFVKIDPHSKEITYSNAGHNNQLFFRASDKKCHNLTTRGVPLGVLENSDYIDGKITYNEGDILLLYTDGVIEAVNEKFEEFGLERVIELLEENQQKDPQEILINFIKEIEKFTIGCKQYDDITIMIVKFDSTSY